MLEKNVEGVPRAMGLQKEWATIDGWYHLYIYKWGKDILFMRIISL